MLRQTKQLTIRVNCSFGAGTREIVDGQKKEEEGWEREMR